MYEPVRGTLILAAGYRKCPQFPGDPSVGSISEVDAPPREVFNAQSRLRLFAVAPRVPSNELRSMPRVSILLRNLPSLLLLSAGLVPSLVRAGDYTLEQTPTAPEGLADAVAAVIDSNGVTIKGPERVACQVWLSKSLAADPGFTPSPAIRYPFTPGELIGALQVPRRAGFGDFRGHEIEDGTYTLRYGRQPMDGNHIGTSDLADFLVAIPADKDESPDVIDDPAKLHELSAEASGTSHPAIFSLQPAEKAPEKPTLEHDEAREFWILDLAPQVKQGDKTTTLPLKVVIVGKAEG